MKIPFTAILEARNSLKEVRSILTEEAIRSVGCKNDFYDKAMAATDKALVPMTMLTMYIDRALAELRVELEHEPD